MRNAQLDRHASAVERDPGRSNVAAPEHADRRLARLSARGIGDALAGPVEDSLHIRQEIDELRVMALLEVVRIAGELVDDLAPRIVGPRVLAEFTMPMNLTAFDQWHQLQGPQEDLSELADFQRATGPQFA